MDKLTLELKDNQEILKDLEKIEDKLHLIIGFYEELGIIRQGRKHLVTNLREGNRIDQSTKVTILSKKVDFNPSYSRLGERTTTKTGSRFEEKKLILQLYDRLENLSLYHKDVKRQIRDLKILKSQNKSNPDLGEGLDTALAKMQKEEDEIDEKIINFVMKNVVEGKAALLQIISNLENENNEMEDMINAMERRESYLKGTITALMLENQSLKKGERRRSEIVRRSLVEKRVSLLLPESLMVNRLSDLDDKSVDDNNELPLFTEQEDLQSVERSTLDSFTLDAPLATWCTDDRSLHDHVKRIGQNLVEMQVNHMKLNLLKRYVERHGAKYINRHTLIDPSKGTESNSTG